MLRPEIRFCSGFPDDYFEGSDDLEEVQGGRNIAEALKAALEPLDYGVSDAINAGDHGWALDIVRARKRFWLQISVIGSDDCYLLAEEPNAWLWPNTTKFKAFLADLKRALDADSRFSQVRWFPSGGINRKSEPSAGPFDS